MQINKNFDEIERIILENWDTLDQFDIDNEINSNLELAKQINFSSLNIEDIKNLRSISEKSNVLIEKIRETKEILRKNITLLKKHQHAKKIYKSTR